MCEFCSRYLGCISPKNGFLQANSSYDRFPLARLAPKEFGFISDCSPPVDPNGRATCEDSRANFSQKQGITGPSLDDAASVAATMKYMVFHALACHLSFVSSALCMTYIYVHLFFALAGLVFSLYLGSAWYDRMLTSHVTKKVRKHIAASTKKD